MNDHEVVAILEEWMSEALNAGDFERYKKLSIDWCVVYTSTLGKTK